MGRQETRRLVGQLRDGDGAQHLGESLLGAFPNGVDSTPFFAKAMAGFTDAMVQLRGAFDSFDDVEQSDLIRCTIEDEAAAAASLGDQQALMDQALEDLREEAPLDAGGGSQIKQRMFLSNRRGGQMNHNANSIISSSSDLHEKNRTKAICNVQ